ncbi:MAG: radical SAM protein, partial [Desulfatitalea sp.]
SDYHDARLTPVSSADLHRAAREPQRNPFYDYYQNQLLPRILDANPTLVGLSINYLSQALCAFALIGTIRQAKPDLKIILGGGLITSWLRRPGWTDRFSDCVDHMVAGPGERILLQKMGLPSDPKIFMPDYGDLAANRYMSPGFILPFSASDGCWWRRCAFCPERAERRPFHPLPHTLATRQLRQLTDQTQPVLIHLLDNAVSPALLKALAADPPGAPWYGFVRIGAPLDDPAFCRQLAAAGCVMLKIGLESGSQTVLDRLEKGVQLNTASKVLRNLRQAGIAAYVYLLFGTPAEDEAAACATLDFVAEHSPTIGFLNIAIFNLPLGSPDAKELRLRNFYEGDLALYQDFKHPAGWNRSAVRRFVERTFKKHPAVQPIVRRDPPIFTSNHAAFFIRS